MLENKIIDRVVRGSIRRWRCKSEELDSAIVAGSRKVFIRRVECNAFDMTLMNREHLQLLECMPRPNHNFRIQTDGYQYRGIVRPTQILYVVFVPDQPP